MKNRYNLYLIFFAVVTISCAWVRPDILPRKGYPIQLNWDTYFKGTPDNRSPYYALTVMTWRYSYESVVQQGRVEINLKNYIEVNKERSWVKREKIKDKLTSDRLLHHEQGHVNIHYLLLKDAERSLKNRTYSVRNYKTEIARIAQEISAYYDEMQNRYDEETNHGINRIEQEKWDNFIEEQLYQ